MAPKKILVPTDFAEHDADAIGVARDVASRSGAEILLLHVVEDPAEEIYGEKSTEGKDRAAWALWKVAKGEIEGRLDALARECLPGESRYRTLCAFGDPATRINEAVAAESIDLVVLGARRRKSLLQGIHLGSVAYRVVRTAPCDVFVVK